VTGPRKSSVNKYAITQARMGPDMEDKVSPFDSLKAWIVLLPGVSEAPHRFGGTEFQVESVEFMHSHGHSWFDIRLSKEDQAAVLKTKQALPHRFAPQAGWVSFQIHGSDDLTQAKKIIQLAYENAKKNLEDIKSRRMQTKF
jgi:hypothetical protein